MTSIDHLSIDSIFPRCIEEYKDVQRTKTGITNTFNNVCLYIVKKLKLEKHNFQIVCITLSNYLKHIDDKSKEDRIPYCKYFNFKIKDELNGLEPTCVGEKRCYEEMISTSDTMNHPNLKVPDSCKDLIQDLDPSTFSLFKNLEHLYYNNLYELLSENEECRHNSPCFNNYKELCKICQNSNNEGLRSVLDKFKEEHLQNVDAASCIKPHKYILSSTIRTVLLTSFIITLSIPFIGLILYEYTPCGLYLQPSIRKLKEIWTKKRKEENQLINTFQSTYDELVDNWSQISYSAIDCN